MSDKNNKSKTPNTAISAAELKELGQAYQNAKAEIESEAAMIKAAWGIMKGTR